jgi:hypothetical protein
VVAAIILLGAAGAFVVHCQNEAREEAMEAEMRAGEEPSRWDKSDASEAEERRDRARREEELKRKWADAAPCAPGDPMCSNPP